MVGELPFVGNVILRLWHFEWAQHPTGQRRAPLPCPVCSCLYSLALQSLRIRESISQASLSSSSSNKSQVSFVARICATRSRSGRSGHQYIHLNFQQNTIIQCFLNCSSGTHGGSQGRFLKNAFKIKRLTHWE